MVFSTLLCMHNDTGIIQLQCWSAPETNPVFCYGLTLLLLFVTLLIKCYDGKPQLIPQEQNWNHRDLTHLVLPFR